VIYILCDTDRTSSGYQTCIAFISGLKFE